jgi:hypothetical protein
MKQKNVTSKWPTVAYNRPNPSLETIPIVLCHEVFPNFLYNCQHHEPTKEDNRWATELRHAMLKEYPSEVERCQKFREIFKTHTNVKLADESIPGLSTRTDGHYTVGQDLVLLSEGKNEWNGLNSDPQLQAFTYYIQYTQSRIEDEKIRRSPLPCLIIYYVGEWISSEICNPMTNSTTGNLIGFAGGVAASRLQYERLIPPVDLASNEHDALALKSFARILGALRSAIKSLNTYYTDLHSRQSLVHLHDPTYPFCNSYTSFDGSKVDFQYEARMDDKKLLFRGSSSDEKKILFIKFTQKYSKEVHEYCASRKIAPDLYAIETFGGGWMMVVMEYLDSDTYTLLKDSTTSPQILRGAVLSAVTTLHQGGFVHGDIRNVNLMVRNEWNPDDGVINLKMIDFDWAGPVGATQYPANVNYEEIRRPQGAWDGQLITKEHDIAMVDFLF